MRVFWEHRTNFSILNKLFNKELLFKTLKMYWKKCLSPEN